MLIGDEWCEKVNHLKDICRCRYSYTSVEDMYDFCMTKCRLKEHCGFMRTPFVYKYNVPGLGLVSESDFEELRTCIIVVKITPEYVNGHPWRSCTSMLYGDVNSVFVKDFKDGELTNTRNICEAKHFMSDKECDEVLEYIVNNKNPFAITIAEYKGNSITSSCIHYPNEYWSINGGLQPSLMNKSVKEWHQEHDKNI